MNYFAWYLMQMQCQAQDHKQKVVLLGDGFFARGFLHNIDRTKFHITQVRREPFINPQDIMSNSNGYHLRDMFNKPADKVINMNIPSLCLPGRSPSSCNVKPGAVHIGDTNLTYDHLVIGLGAKKSLLDWQKEIKALTASDVDVNIVGMGPTGIELAFLLAGTRSVSLYDSLPKEKVLSYLSVKGKQTVLEKLKEHNIKTTYGTFYNGSGTAVFCVGTQQNPLVTDFKVNEKLEVQGVENVHMGGDCAQTPYPKSAQVAYQQGSYVARKLNGELSSAPFKYQHEGTSLTIGSSKALVEGHRYVPNGVYPDIILRLYSLFCV